MGQCPNCGTVTSPDHAFCLHCGAVLETAPDLEVLPSTPASARPPTPGPSTPGKPMPGRSSGDRGGARRSRKQSSETLIPMTLALALTILLEELVNTVVAPDSYLHRLFRPAGGWGMSIVPGLIAFSLIWSLTDLLLKFRIARENERDLDRSEVTRLPSLVAQESTSATLQRLRGWDGRILARPVGRKVLWLLQHLDTTDAQRAHELTRHQSDLEADAAASGYRTVKLLIWAMPILGFIGTVVGISLAVGGFSTFLTTNVSIDDIDRVTQELGNVAGGLSFAFDTTLLGLLGGLIASVVSSAVQAREERCLTRLEELGLRIMESAMPFSAAKRPSASAAEMPSEAFERMMGDRLAQLSGQMDQFTKAVRVGLDGFLGQWAKLPPEVERVAADLSGLREHLAGAAKSTDQLILETRVLLEGLKEASGRMSDGLEVTIGSVSDTVESLGTELQGVADSLARSVDALGDRMKAEEGMKTLSASIATLGERLTELKEAQASLAPILGQLMGPLELRLMPTPTSPPNGR
jgi:biopolymer transport protein ExbB/TolQ